MREFRGEYPDGEFEPNEKTKRLLEQWSELTSTDPAAEWESPGSEQGGWSHLRAAASERGITLDDVVEGHIAELLIEESAPVSAKEAMERSSASTQHPSLATYVLVYAPPVPVKIRAKVTAHFIQLEFVAKSYKEMTILVDGALFEPSTHQTVSLHLSQDFGPDQPMEDLVRQFVSKKVLIIWDKSVNAADSNSLP